MNNKHTKFWAIAFIITLSIAGGAASYASQNATLYRGEVTLAEAETHNDEGGFSGKIAQASVLDFSETDETARAAEPEEAPILNQTPEQTPPLAPAPSPKRSPCEETEIAVIRNGKFIGCRPKIAVQIQDAAPEKGRSEPNSAEGTGKPKIARIQTAADNTAAEAPASFTSSPTCESQSFFAYTGPDRPGLLYGMCIECETSEFVFNNGACPR